MLDLKRFVLLLRKQAVENHRLYLLAVALFTGVLSCFYALTYPALQRPGDFQEVLFISSLFFGGCVFANLVVKDLHETTRAIWFLMLPASTLEKILNIFLYSVVLFIPVHLLLFYAVDIAAVTIYNTHHPGNPTARVLDLFDETSKRHSQYIAFLVVQALIMIGSVCFRQYSLVKSLLSVFACYILVLYVNKAIAALLMDEEVAHAFPFQGFAVTPDGTDEMQIYIDLPEAVQNAAGPGGFMLTVCLWLVLAVFLWVAAYFKLKERQV